MSHPDRFCELLHEALNNAPGAESRTAIQALINAHCGDGVQPLSGDNGPPPPRPPHRPGDGDS